MTFQQLVSVPATSFTPLAASAISSSSAETRYPKIRYQLRQNYPLTVEKINYGNPFELLIATILLPQATASEVNAVTPQIFERYATPALLLQADRRELEQLIRCIGFYRQKAKYLQLTSQMLLTHHDGEVPKTMTSLTKLPGVARKTANFYLAELYGRAEGVIVDTRVKRVAKRLGIADGKSAEAIENDLMRLMPRQDWLDMPQLMIALADSVCSIRTPACTSCPLHAMCPSAQ